MIVAIPMFLFSVLAGAIGGFLLLNGPLLLVPALLLFLISAVLMSGCFIVVAIVDLEKAVKQKK